VRLAPLGRPYIPTLPQDMARDRAARDSRYLYEENSDDQREREREERRYRRRHRHRDDFDYDYEDHKQRRERRKAEEARRQADLDIDELRARRESYYSRPETDRRRDSQRMAQDTRGDREKERPRSSKKEVRRDGTVRRKKRRETVEGARDDEYVYGPPGSRPVVEEVTVRRSSGIRRSDEGGSSNRTQHTPLSGSRSASLRKEEVPMLNRTMSARDPRVYMTRPSVRRTSTTKLPAAPVATAPPLSRSHTVSAKDTRRSSGLLATFFRAPPRPQTAVHPKEVPRFVSVYADHRLS
jgi:hypothetical protein